MDLIYKPLPFLISDIVDKVRINFDTNEVKVFPIFDYGTGIEIVNRLSEKDGDIDNFNKKYPLIWLYFKDSVLSENVDPTKGIRSRNPIDVTIVICAESKQEYTSKERYDNTIIPTLRPLYEMFMYYLNRSAKVKSIDGFKHKYTENLFWGRDGLYGHTGNILNDKVDAIIIENLNLQIIESC